MVEKLKEKPGLVALGLAAVATAGYLLLKKGGQAAEEPGSEGTMAELDETQTQGVIENNFFMDPEFSLVQKQDKIEKWLKDQLDHLLGQQDDGKLTVIDKKLQKEDYYKIKNMEEGFYTITVDQ